MGYPAVSQSIDAYLDVLIDAKFTQRGQYLEPERAAEIKRDLEREFEQFLLKRSLEELSEPDRHTVLRMWAQDEPPEEITDYMKTHIADSGGFFISVCTEFARGYLGLILWGYARVPGSSGLITTIPQTVSSFGWSATVSSGQRCR
jgi:hypothetical protein